MASPPAKVARTDAPAGIALVGAAWWAQGWHLPHLHRNPDAKLVAIVQRSEQPTAAAFLNLALETKTQLGERYGVPIYGSVEELIADEEAMKRVDGVVCRAGTRLHGQQHGELPVSLEKLREAWKSTRLEMGT